MEDITPRNRSMNPTRKGEPDHGCWSLQVALETVRIFYETMGRTGDLSPIYLSLLSMVSRVDRLGNKFLYSLDTRYRS